MKNGQKIKALVLSHSSELSGAELSMIDLFDYWDGEGVVEPHFIIRRPLKGMQKELKKRDWNYTALYYTNWSQRRPTTTAEHVYRGALFNTKAIFAIEKLITAIKPDLVMTNTIVSPWAAIAAYFQQVPHIWFVREYGDLDHNHIFEIGRDNMFKDIDTMSSLIVANSKTLAKDISTLINPSKVTTLYNPFDLGLLRARGSEQVPNPFKHNGSLRVVITGRIAPSKGQDIAAESIGLLTKDGYNVELCVIGSPSESQDADKLLAIIDKYGIQDRVHIVGKKANPLAYVMHADVGITASHKEAFGRVTFEYMAVGKPVVGANSGATPELIDNAYNGFLYEMGNARDLAKQLLHYVGNADLIARQSQAGAKKAERMVGAGGYTADALYEKINEISSRKETDMSQPLNFSHRWLEYPQIADKYIKDTDVISLPHILYRRIRQLAKSIYLWAHGDVTSKKTGK